MKALDALRRAFGVEVESAEEFPLSREKTSAGSAGDYHLGPDDGVRVSPMPVTAEEEVKIAYSGLLAQAGAGDLYLHCGEGPGPWNNVRDIPMQQKGNEWLAQLEVGKGGTLEFCFRDGGGNWDNNGGVDWAVTVHAGRLPH